MKYVVMIICMLSIICLYRSDSDDENYVPPARVAKALRLSSSLREKIGPDGVLKKTTATATRFKISVRAHMALVASTVNAINGDIEELPISPATTARHRKSAQMNEAIQISSCIKQDMLGTLKVVHWDSKITEFLTTQGHKDQDVNAVVVSTPLGNGPVFLGAPVMKRGTGLSLAETTISVLKSWDCIDGLIAASFDTTSTNTGVKEGAALKIEQHLNKAILCCRLL